MRAGAGVLSLRVLGVRRLPYTTRDRLKGLTGRLRFSILTKSYLHVGSGRESLDIGEDLLEAVRSCGSLEEIVDRIRRGELRVSGSECLTVVRYGGLVCVPGSSIKGLVRSRLELTVRPVDDYVEACLRVISQSGGRRAPASVMHARIWGDSLSLSRDQPCNPLSLGSYDLCPVCNIFGAPGVASRVFFGNACSNAETSFREFEKGMCLELIPPQTVFSGELMFLGLAPEELGLILIGMGARKDGGFNDVLLGRSKYRRLKSVDGKLLEFGRVVFSVNSISFRKYGGVNVREALRLPESCKEHNGYVECDSQAVGELVPTLVDLAVSKFKSFAETPNFSEALKRDELISGGGQR